MKIDTTYKGIGIHYDSEEDEDWHITIEGQEMAFLFPSEAQEAIDAYFNMLSLMNVKLYGNNLDNNIETFTLAAFGVKDSDELILLDKSGKEMPHARYWVREEHLPKLRKYIELSKEWDAIREMWREMDRQIDAVAEKLIR